MTPDAERAEALVRAACEGRMREARRLLAENAAVARFDLATACATGEFDAVAAHLARDADAARRTTGPLDREPILYACFSRFLRTDPGRAAGIVEAVKLLLAHGADPNAHYFTTDAEPWIQTALFGAAGIANNAASTKLLLDAGADVNELQAEPAADSYKNLGTEALYHASEFADVECLRLLLEAGPAARRVSYCLGRALDFDNPAAAKLYLEHGADPNFRVPWMHGRTHLHRAVIYGRASETIEAMLDRGADARAIDDLGVSAYRYAVRYGRATVASLLAARGATDEGVTDDDRRTGAVIAGEATARPETVDAELFTRVASLGDAAVVNRLLDAGADVDGAGDPMPPLHSAGWHGHYEAARLLVSRGASLTVRNPHGGDALGSTVHGSEFCHNVEGGMTMRLAEEVAHGDYPAIVEMLIEAGAPLPAAVRCGSDAVRAILRRHGVPEAVA